MAAPSLRHRSLLPFAALIACWAVVLTFAVPAGATSRDPRVIPPIGPTYGVLSAAWWQYVASFPTATNPLFDESGAGCATRQFGPVFFLVGGGGTASATRNMCRVPKGKALFFPLVNAFDVHVPGDALYTPELVWDDLKITNGFRVLSMHASIDGMDVGNLDPATSPYRGCAGPVSGCAPRSFSLTFPPGNPFNAPAGTFKPAVADGFYLLLAPLSAGPHTITFGGKGQFPADFTQDITYNLVVK